MNSLSLKKYIHASWSFFYCFKFVRKNSFLSIFICYDKYKCFYQWIRCEKVERWTALLLFDLALKALFMISFQRHLLVFILLMKWKETIWTRSYQSYSLHSYHFVVEYQYVNILQAKNNDVDTRGLCKLSHQWWSKFLNLRSPYRVWMT